jgi:hypothetical protein
MIAARLIDMLLAVLVGVSVTGCATMSLPGNAVVRPTGPTPVRADPEQIYNDPLQGP